MIRLLLTLAVVLFLLLCVGAMAWGYRNRARRQAAVLPAFPTPPEHLDPASELLRTEGTYVSTTTAASWQDRVAVSDIGFRSRCVAVRYACGVLFDREGATAIWLPEDAIVGARLAKGLAGKVMGTESLLVLRWERDGHRFDTGFLPRDLEQNPTWLAALQRQAEHTATRGERR